MAKFKHIGKPRLKNGMSNVLLTCSRTENPSDFNPKSLRLSRIPGKYFIFNQYDLEMDDYLILIFG